jgi:hypothetical protein
MDYIYLAQNGVHWQPCEHSNKSLFYNEAEVSSLRELLTIPLIRSQLHRLGFTLSTKIICNKNNKSFG